jgi:putative oxidoreductase
MPLLQSSRDLLTIPMRFALVLALLTSVSDGCGLLRTPGVAWRNFANFLSYSAAINSFAPSMLQLALAKIATILEGSLVYFSS